MAANIQLQDDGQDPITYFPYGTISGGANATYKFYVKNVGDTAATSVLVSALRVDGSDGVDFVLLALDVSGNPGSYTASALSLGTLAAGDSIAIWAKVTVPSGTSPAGNPRQWSLAVDYSGT
jgi:hypothetical protein